MIDPQWRAARRILAVRLDNLGDVLVTTPALHAIKASLPDAHLTLLASPVGAQVGRLNPDLDGVIAYQAPWMDPWRRLPQDPAREQRMIATIRDGRFDGAIIFGSFRQSPLPAAYLCYLAGIPLRAAASIDGPGSLLTTRHKHPERMMHEVERGLDLVGALGLGTDERDLVLRVPDEARAGAHAFLEGLAQGGAAPPAPQLWGEQDRGQPGASPGGWGADSVLSPQGWGAGGAARPLVVIHPGCTMPARTYPWEEYAAVADRLVERLGATIVLTGAADERELVGRIQERLRPETRRATHACAGTLPFPEFCALIEAADLTVTNNTGPMHVAAAVKTPVVALFALTNPPEQWGPWQAPHRLLYHDVPCRICYSRVCPYGHECLRLVTPDDVVAAAAELLRTGGGEAASSTQVPLSTQRSRLGTGAER